MIPPDRQHHLSHEVIQRLTSRINRFPSHQNLTQPIRDAIYRANHPLAGLDARFAVQNARVAGNLIQKIGP